MLPKNKRLTSGEVEHVLKYGKFFRTSFYTIRYSTAVTTAKFAVVVSKKVAPTSVQRHVTKRSIYEALRMNIVKLGATTPLHAAIVVTCPANTFTKERAHTTIVSALTKCVGTL
jgi:ribonuclease P protein component